MPLNTATRPRREISQESTPTRASPPSSSQSPASSSLRRSSRSTRGQSPNRLIQGSSDQTHLGKGPSRQTPAAHLVHIEEADRSSRSARGQSPNCLIQGSSDQMHLGKGPSRQPPAAHLVHIEEADPSHFYKSSSNLSSFPSCSIPTAFLATRASPSSSQPQFPSPISSSLRRSSRSARGQSPNRLIQGSSDQTHLGKGPSRQTPAAHLVHVVEEADPSHFYKSSSNLSTFPSCSIPTAFLVATQPGLTATYDLNGITQPHAFKASKSDPDIQS
jgi:hypothetical protein